jgi:hypothetical protein
MHCASFFSSYRGFYVVCRELKEYFLPEFAKIFTKNSQLQNAFNGIILSARHLPKKTICCISLFLIFFSFNKTILACRQPSPIVAVGSRTSDSSRF